MPVENIPVYVMMGSVAAFSISMMQADYKSNQRNKVAARVRRAEVHRRAMAAMAASRRERANKCAGRYHGLV